MSEPSVSSITIYQFRVVLCGVSPLVWRRLLVASDTSIAELHEILQSAFDWSGEHLHISKDFTARTERYGAGSALPETLALASTLRIVPW